MTRQKTDQATTKTPLGQVRLTATDGAITRLEWWEGEALAPASPLMAKAVIQLDAYFDGSLKDFDLPLAPAGPDMHQKVWEQMLAIPKGETRTYGDVAKKIGAAAQPVGQACGANPIPIIIPCHRIVGTGHLGGFSAPGGVETKVALLKHEGAYGLLL